MTTQTLAQIQTARATAGADYAAKAQALVDAWVVLAAYDSAVESCGGGHGGAHFTNHPTILDHGQYLPRATRDAMTSPNVIGPARDSQAAAIIANWSGS